MKPIHKFNGGRGATLCNNCKSIISEGLTEDLYCENCNGTEDYKYKLVRERDGLTKQSKEIMWLEWTEEGRFKAKHTEPAIGRSLLMSPFNDFFTWQTTDITEIVEQREDYIKFNTKNSVYELFKI